jgi:hypothetical protein
LDLLCGPFSIVVRLQYSGLLNPGGFVGTRGLLLLEPYDSNKAPILMIHGLMSSPLTWKGLTNELLGDAYIRTHYQVWHYVYPTGQSLFYSAKGLRDSLDALKSAIALARLPQPKPMVVIGHSMGAAKSLVCDSGDNLWDAVFTVPPERLVVSKDALNDLRGSFFSTAKRCRESHFYGNSAAWELSSHQSARTPRFTIGSPEQRVERKQRLFEVFPQRKV